MQDLYLKDCSLGLISTNFQVPIDRSILLFNSGNLGDSFSCRDSTVVQSVYRQSTCGTARKFLGFNCKNHLSVVSTPREHVIDGPNWEQENEVWKSELWSSRSEHTPDQQNEQPGSGKIGIFQKLVVSSLTECRIVNTNWKPVRRINTKWSFRGAQRVSFNNACLQFLTLKHWGFLFAAVIDFVNHWQWKIEVMIMIHVNFHTAAEWVVDVCFCNSAVTGFQSKSCFGNLEETSRKRWSCLISTKIKRLKTKHNRTYWTERNEENIVKSKSLKSSRS